MTAFPLLVLDASAALALLLAEEEGEAVAAKVEETIRLNGQIFVPGIFWYELANGMLNAERRKRMKREEVDAAERLLARLPFVTHPASDAADRRGIHDLARRHDLSFYDASYLELALRHQARLASCDNHLRRLTDSYPALFHEAG